MDKSEPPFPLNDLMDNSEALLMGDGSVRAPLVG